MEDDASRRFVDAWRRAERGQTFHERHLAFESWEALARILSGKRMELLHYVRWHNVTSVRALAKALSRDYSNVHADVQALATPGFWNPRTAVRGPTTTPLKPGSRFKAREIDSGFFYAVCPAERPARRKSRYSL